MRERMLEMHSVATKRVPRPWWDPAPEEAKEVLAGERAKKFVARVGGAGPRVACEPGLGER